MWAKGTCRGGGQEQTVSDQLQKRGFRLACRAHSSIPAAPNHAPHTQVTPRSNQILLYLDSGPSVHGTDLEEVYILYGDCAQCTAQILSLLRQIAVRRHYATDLF